MVAIPTQAKDYRAAMCLEENPYHLLVNKEYSISKEYTANNLRKPNVRFASAGNIDKNYLEATAATALENLFNGAKADNLTLVAVSGYRSYNYQNNLYDNAVRQNGVNQKGSAKPNESEHRTGLAMDVNSITQGFANTKEGMWLADNAHKYGWIIRYPKGKTSITGYIYEPWHIRYVGEELATYCYENDLTLEEIVDAGGCCKLQRGEFVELKEPLINTWLENTN